MIELFGLEGYTGHRVASDLMVQEQMLVWTADSAAQAEREKRQKAEIDAAKRG